VLIHAGSGAIGLAAIAIASSFDCDIYTTVSTEEKKQFVKVSCEQIFFFMNFQFCQPFPRQNLFPGIRDDHFLNSRDTTFLPDIMRLTDNRGVDVVLNSLAEDMLLAGVECLAQDGRFLEIGKYDMMENSRLGMKCFLRNINFISVVGERLHDVDNLDWPEVSV